VRSPSRVPPGSRLERISLSMSAAICWARERRAGSAAELPGLTEPPGLPR
jgi:hypothetical protein